MVRLNISHKDANEVTKFIKYLNKYYGDSIILRGKEYDYIGIDSYLSGTVNLKYPYINKIEAYLNNLHKIWGK